MTGKTIDPPNTCKGHCPKCGEGSNADIVASFAKEDDFAHEVIWAIDTYRILQCRGCEQVYFQHEHMFSEDEYGVVDPETGEIVMVPKPHVTYCPPPKKRECPQWLAEIDDDKLRNLLYEDYGALNAGLRVLAAIGARTALDRAMVLNGAEEALPFKDKLKMLLEEGVIGEDERRILGILIKAGHAATHRSWEPPLQDLYEIFGVMETFLQRTLVHGKAVDKLKDNLPARQGRTKKPPESSQS